MPRRIDVELTSSRDDGSWTWRAAGAREPKGVVPGDLLYPGAKVGDVVKAEADFDIDGITITSVSPPRAKATPGNVIQVTGAPRDFQPVTTSLVPRREGQRRDRDFAGGDRDRDRRPRPPGADRGPRPGPAGDRGGRPGTERRERTGGERTGRGAPQGDRPGRERAEPAARRDRPTRPASRPEPAPKPRPKRLSPSSKHRAAVLETLSPEQRPIAEQVLRGGIPAVRRAIEEQNTQARAEGLPEVKADALVAMAEQLLPRLKTAEWHDRADAALADIDQIGLRDLRSVVSGADAAARDDETRALAVSLREALERRVKKEQDDWIGEITTALAEGRLVRALRVASRPPDAGMRIPAELAMSLSSAASEAMSPDVQPDRWMALLEAVAASPVRTTVKPAGLPAEPGEALLHAAGQQAGRVPALAALLGIAMPPPPGPVRRPPRPAGPPAAGARPRPIPPPPARRPPPPAPSAEAPPASAGEAPAPSAEAPPAPAGEAPEAAAEAPPATAAEAPEAAPSPAGPAAEAAPASAGQGPEAPLAETVQEPLAAPPPVAEIFQQAPAAPAAPAGETAGDEATAPEAERAADPPASSDANASVNGNVSAEAAGDTGPAPAEPGAGAPAPGSQA